MLNRAFECAHKFYLDNQAVFAAQYCIIFMTKFNVSPEQHCEYQQPSISP